MEKYTTEFDLYNDGRKGNYQLQGYIAFIPILKYVVFAIILLIKNCRLQCMATITEDTCIRKFRFLHL